MKWLLWALLLVNLVFFVFMQWGVSALGIGNTSPNLAPSLNAEKVRLLVTTQVSSTSSVAAASQVQPASASACLEWGEFSGTDLVRANAALDAMNLGGKLSQRQVEYTSGYWAYIPPSKTLAETGKKIAILKARGVDHFIVQEAGKWHNAISLGVFKTSEAANKFLEALRAKNIRTALVGERMSKLKFTVFMMKDLDAGENVKIRVLQSEFFGSELKELPCS